MPTLLHRERIRDFAVHPTSPHSLSVEVEPGVLLSSTGQPITGGVGQDTANYASSQILSSVQTVGPFVPPSAGNIRRDTILIATDLSLHVQAGVAVPTPGPGLVRAYPANLIPLAQITISDVTATISTGEIQDVRPFLMAHQDRNRKIRVPVLQPGAAPPVTGTTGDFSLTRFAQSVDQDVKFALTVPEDFDYNRVMNLNIRNYTGGAGGSGFHQWDVRVTRVALSGGSFPPGGGITKSSVHQSFDDSTYRVNTIPIANASGAGHFALRVLLPGDLLSVVIIRKGTNPSDTYSSFLEVVEVTIDYNVGSSVYPG